MKLRSLLMGIIVFWGLHLSAQRLIDRSGTVMFFSEAPLENIEATNNQALAAIDMGTGNVAVSMLMKAFRFEKALMEEHFNENFVESDKYPKATFKGKIGNFDPEVFRKGGKLTLPVKGEITIHGVTRDLSTDVDFTVNQEDFSANVVFVLAVKDFNIKIPMAVVNNIAEEVEVTVNFNFDKPEE